ncbi:hypothetical protein H9L39_16864 [Fusarium oxysporum f. sp. albedinis]|nr:hypothetical protein H9L39_16864 [Fusarium oxysporum f. sp. albedinis]
MNASRRSKQPNRTESIFPQRRYSDLQRGAPSDESYPNRQGTTLAYSKSVTPFGQEIRGFL